MRDGLYCDGGYKHVFVDWNGNTYICRSSAAHLGNLLKEDIVLRSEEYIPCPFNRCLFDCIGAWTKQRHIKDGEVILEKNRWHDGSQFKRPLFIWFNPTMLCNYSCEYCVGKNHISTSIIPVDQFISAFEKFFQLNGIDGGVCQFNGGEAMIYPGIGALMNYFFKKGFLIELLTNLSGDVYKDIVMQVPPNGVNCIIATIHPLEKKFQWESFEGKVLLLRSLGYTVIINFVGHPDQIMLAEKYHKWCKDNGLRLQVIPLQGDTGGQIFNTENDYPEPLRRMFHLDDKIT